MLQTGHCFLSAELIIKLQEPVNISVYFPTHWLNLQTDDTSKICSISNLVLPPPHWVYHCTTCKTIFIFLVPVIIAERSLVPPNWAGYHTFVTSHQSLLQTGHCTLIVLIISLMAPVIIADCQLLIITLHLWHQ